MNRFVFVYVDSLPHARVRRGARIVPYKYAVRQPIVQDPSPPSGRLAGCFRRRTTPDGIDHTVKAAYRVGSAPSIDRVAPQDGRQAREMRIW